MNNHFQAKEVRIEGSRYRVILTCGHKYPHKFILQPNKNQFFRCKYCEMKEFGTDKLNIRLIR